jgi:predicted RNA-binding protein with RPS1 domain
MFTQNDVRKHMKEGDEIFAKVYIVSGKDRYSLDYRFVDQRTGEDLDPHNEQRDVLEKTANNGDGAGSGDKHGDRHLDLPPLNRVFFARVFSITIFGCFVELIDRATGSVLEYKHGLLPRGKTLVRGARGFNDTLTAESRIEDSYRKGDELYVKVVDVQGEKYNVDMRYVDQKTGEDLDPMNDHSNDKAFLGSGGGPPNRTERAGVDRTRRYTDGGFERRRPARATSRSRSRSVRRNRHDRDDEDVIKRPGYRRPRSRSPARVGRSRSIDRRRHESSPPRKGFSFYSNEKKDNGDVIQRRRY